jgi:ubiquinone/menaquinone biosynthesis C-methylase UbiE
MPDHFQEIYRTQAERYDRLVSREDFRGNILSALVEICPLADLEVVEFGAGTGRLTRLLALMVKHIQAYDISLQMLEVAKTTLELTGSTNWTLTVGDNRNLPAEANSADLTVAGWSFGHSQSWYPDTWRDEIGKALAEMSRILRPGGTTIIMETMGTGQRQPAPPHEGLAAYYAWLENDHGFSYKWIRTDYQFESVAEADELTRFFFGDELADRIVQEQLMILPECTGIWWRMY